MAIRHRIKRSKVAQTDLDMTVFMNLLMVLVPFLLLTAVFSRINILELTLPSGAASAVASEPKFRLEVIVRKIGIELTNGQVLIAAIPNVGGAHDLETLSQMVVALKRQYPDANDASVLLEPEIEYDHLIQVMDVVRSAEVAPTSAIGAAVSADVAAAGALAATASNQAAGSAVSTDLSGSTGPAGPAVPNNASSVPSASEAVATLNRPVRVALFTDISVGDAP